MSIRTRSHNKHHQKNPSLWALKMLKLVTNCIDDETAESTSNKLNASIGNCVKVVAANVKLTQQQHRAENRHKKNNKNQRNKYFFLIFSRHLHIAGQEAITKNGNEFNQVIVTSHAS